MKTHHFDYMDLTELNIKQVAFEDSSIKLSAPTSDKDEFSLLNEDLSGGDVSVSDVTSTEIGHLDGVSSNLQTQLDNKAAKSFAIAQAVALG